MAKFVVFFIVLGSVLGFGSPEEGLERLMRGNERFASDQLMHKNRGQERRDETKYAQSPFAIVLTCSDSRVSPEILFDQGIGDLFVVRVAGNVAGPIELASIGYSAVYLGSQVLLVMGHQNCGAVKAVMAGTTKDIEPIARLIKPGINKASDLETAIKENVQHVTLQLKKAPLLKGLIESKKLIVIGGYFDLKTGKVEILK